MGTAAKGGDRLMAAGGAKVGDAQLQGSPARYYTRWRGARGCALAVLQPLPPTAGMAKCMQLQATHAGQQGATGASGGVQWAGSRGAGGRVHTGGVAWRLGGCGKAYR